MRKIKWLFPLMFFIALGGSAFTNSTVYKAKYTVVPAWYQDMYGYCDFIDYEDYFDNCVSIPQGNICYEFIPGAGMTVLYQNGNGGITCWNPYYSYYPNN
jgi:hypothetical protein